MSWEYEYDFVGCLSDSMMANPRRLIVAEVAVDLPTSGLATAIHSYYVINDSFSDYDNAMFQNNSSLRVFMYVDKKNFLWDGDLAHFIINGLDVLPYDTYPGGWVYNCTFSGQVVVDFGTYWRIGFLPRDPVTNIPLAIVAKGALRVQFVSTVL